MVKQKQTDQENWKNFSPIEEKYIIVDYDPVEEWKKGTPFEKEVDAISFKNWMKLKKLVKKEAEGDKIILEIDNKIRLPNSLAQKLKISVGDEMFADIFDEELKQIVIGKKLEGKDALKGLDKISEILTKDK